MVRSEVGDGSADVALVVGKERRERSGEAKSCFVACRQDCRQEGLMPAAHLASAQGQQGPPQLGTLPEMQCGAPPVLSAPLPMLGRHADLAGETYGPDRHSCDPAAEPRCCTPQKIPLADPIFLFPAVVLADSGDEVCGRSSAVLRPGESIGRVPCDYLPRYLRIAEAGQRQSSLPRPRQKSDHNCQLPGFHVPLCMSGPHFASSM